MNKNNIVQVYTSPPLALFGLSVVPPVALLGAYHGRRLRAMATRVQVRPREALAIRVQVRPRGAQDHCRLSSGTVTGGSGPWPPECRYGHGMLRAMATRVQERSREAQGHGHLISGTATGGFGSWLPDGRYGHGRHRVMATRWLVRPRKAA